MLGGPDLAVRVRVARAHHRAAVLEDLHVADPGAAGQLGVLLGPDVHHAPDRVTSISASVRSWRGEKQTTRQMPRSLSATGAGAYRAHSRVDAYPRRRVGQQRGVVVVEHEGRGVVRVAHAAGALVAGAEVARRVVGRALLGGRMLDLALPGALRAVRRDQHPLAGERVEPAVRRREAGGIVHQSPLRTSAKYSIALWSHSASPVTSIVRAIPLLAPA